MSPPYGLPAPRDHSAAHPPPNLLKEASGRPLDGVTQSRTSYGLRGFAGAQDAVRASETLRRLASGTDCRGPPFIQVAVDAASFPPDKRDHSALQPTRCSTSLSGAALCALSQIVSVLPLLTELFLSRLPFRNAVVAGLRTHRAIFLGERRYEHG